MLHQAAGLNCLKLHKKSRVSLVASWQACQPCVLLKAAMKQVTEPHYKGIGAREDAKPVFFDQAVRRASARSSQAGRVVGAAK